MNNNNNNNNTTTTPKSINWGAYASDLARNTCCSGSFLSKDGKPFVGISNGLSYWGKVIDPHTGEKVEDLCSSWNEECHEHDQFDNCDWIAAGYEVWDDEKWREKFGFPLF